MKKIAASDPINRTAAIVVGKGTSFAPEMELSHVRRWSAKPQEVGTKPPTGGPDMTGVRQGRLVVVGYYGPGKKCKSGTTLWVVRCDCGMFETRRTHALKNPNNSGDRCYDCRKLEQMQRNDEYRRLGYNREVTK